MFYIAVDLGAGSGRVFLADVSDAALRLDEVRRFRYPQRHTHGHLRWDFGLILSEIQQGLREAGARVRGAASRISSLGVDSWGVDYGLVDAAGALLEDPVCYRDDRTAGAMAAAFAVVPRAEIFARTGIQFLPFNTLYQLIAHAGEGLPSRAARLLLIPDLVHAALTGREVVEYTNATTTQMVNAGTRAWDDLLLATLSLPRHLLGDIVPAGTVVGPLKPEVSDALGLAGVPVVAPATHDTASAVVGTPLAAGEAYISSGTWSLVGVERAAPLVTPEVGRHNFTNEGGAFGTIRFLKNVMGLWILESCRAEWQVCGTDVTYERLLSEAAAIACSPGLVFPDDPRFLNPPGMRAALGAQMLERGAAMPAGPAAVTRVILDSLALRYASVLRAIEALTGEPLRRVHVTGGGSRNAYLNQATANATGLPVSAGPVEATVIGNVMVQAVSAGQFGSLGDARAYLRERVHVEEFEPRPSAEWDRLTQAYADLESVFD